MLVDDDSAAIVELDAGSVAECAGRVRAPTHGHKKLVYGEFFLAVLGGIGEIDFSAFDLGLRKFRAELDLEALLCKFARCGFGDIRIGRAEKVGQCFDDRDIAAEPLPYTAELEPDDAGSDHTESLGDAFEIECAGVVDDELAVEFRERKFNRHGARCDDHVGCRDRLPAAVRRGHFHLAILQQLAGTVQRRDLVAFEEEADAAGELFDDLVLAADHRRDVDRSALGRDAVHVEMLRQVPELLGRIEQRFGRNAADVEARAAERGLAVLADPLVDAGNLEPELRRPDGRVVTGGAGTDDDYVVFVHRKFPSSKFPPLQGEGRVGMVCTMRGG